MIVTQSPNSVIITDGTDTVTVSTSGSQHISINEFENGVSVNENTQLKVTQFDSSGNEGVKLIDSSGNDIDSLNPLPTTSTSSSGSGTKLIDENGLAYGVKHINNKPRTVTTPYYAEIAEGQIPGHTALFKFGHNPSISTSYETVWTEGGIYPWAAIDAAPGQVTISSSSTNDVATSGTGAWTLTIYGLDIDGLEQNETLSLNGQNAVTSNGSYSRVNRIIVNTAGTLQWNDGIIYAGTGAVATGKPAVVWARVETHDNQTLMAVWTVPTDKILYLINGTASISGSKGGEIRMYIRPSGGLFQIANMIHLAGGLEVFPFDFPLVVSAGTDIDMRGIATASGTDMSTTFTGWTE